MPVILPKDKEKLWLESNLEKEAIQSMLVPYNMNEMEAHTVPDLVNRLGFNTHNSDVIKEQEYPDSPII